MSYVTLSLGCYMVCCYNCLFSGRLYVLELLAFMFIRVLLRPSDLKIKYPVASGYQFLLKVVFACCYMKGLARLRYHCYTSIV